MQHKFLLILPISIIGLLSCMPDSTPKSLSYEETLSYINKNYKELTSVPTGYVEYSTDYKDNPMVEAALVKLGADEPISSTGRNDINPDTVSEYIADSGNETYLSIVANLSLMYLSPTNFPIFVNNGANYTYQLTYVKELVMNATVKNASGSIIFTYTRYYNTSLHLTRFEVNSTEENKSYTATQTFMY